MLKLTKINKIYKTGSFVQEALKGVSLEFRENEFVAILGHSGSGKTTLLNIIGGLDKYTSGDLIINGVSTKQYSSRDWDSYRNHTVGFVFQSYNLIPHQTVLSNVELSLTIGGISKSERRARALEALDKVGLGEHVHKKPSQLSGGQMQRVAIARALVNNPKVLLADEPTGALDSDTSIQVMDLLKEVAKDRLVVMVTHNPELAKSYATRIVTLRDGQITDDTDPYNSEKDNKQPTHKNFGRAAMSFLTALSLSFNNLWTKKVRTLLVSFAGSIGIIGIALILSVSNGVNAYIKGVEEDSLKGFPLTITDTSFNFALMLDSRNTDETPPEGENYVKELSTITSFLSKVNKNDLKSLYEFIESGESDIKKYVQDIEYSYSVTPYIYLHNDSITRQVNPDNTFAPLGIDNSASLSGMLSEMSVANTFTELPQSEKLYVDQYTVCAGHWPENYNECVIILNQKGFVRDLTLYTLGMKNPENLDNMVQAFAVGEAIPDKEDNEKYYTYDEFLGKSFKFLYPDDYYTYDSSYDIWTNRSNDESYLKSKLDTAESIKVVGIVKPNEDSSSSTIIGTGIGYPASLVEHIIEHSIKSDIVKDQLKNPDRDVTTGKQFDEKSTNDSFDFSSLFTVDFDSISNLFSFDSDKLNIDTSKIDLSKIDLSKLNLGNAFDISDFSSLLDSLSEEEIASLMKGIKINISYDDVLNLLKDLLQGYAEYASSSPSTDFSRLPSSVREFLMTDAAMDLIREKISDVISENSKYYITPERLSDIASEITTSMTDYIEANYEGTEADFGQFRSLILEYFSLNDTKELFDSKAAELRESIEKSLMSEQQLTDIVNSLSDAYSLYASENNLPDPKNISSSLSEYINSAAVQKKISDMVINSVDISEMKKAAEKILNNSSSEFGKKLNDSMENVFSKLSKTIKKALSDNIGTISSQLSDNIKNLFKVDSDSLADVFNINMTGTELRDLMTSLMSTNSSTYESVLKSLGYAEKNSPSSIIIYPIDFEGKGKIKDIIADYNDQMEKSGNDEKVIVYTDLVDSLTSSITTIVDAISGVLIAFVAISLVVSSVMIGVITYISVLERKKEIGILRAIGASKRNISEVFNAETIIIGAMSGLLGIGLSYILIIPINQIISSISEGVDIKAVLPITSALILVGISIILTLLGGLIPSRKAAHSDPVTALRAE